MSICSRNLKVKGLHSFLRVTSSKSDGQSLWSVLGSIHPPSHKKNIYILMVLLNSSWFSLWLMFLSIIEDGKHTEVIWWFILRLSFFFLLFPISLWPLWPIGTICWRTRRPARRSKKRRVMQRREAVFWLQQTLHVTVISYIYIYMYISHLLYIYIYYMCIYDMCIHIYIYTHIIRFTMYTYN